ncbi:MAG TPA: VCBS repeat-containing protein, partial [Ornithinibacter sp.]|nr:VCBS repeat-containing protein [Ornithinibacter sp.]
QSLVVGGTVVAIDVPAGPYLRLAGDDVVLVVAGQRVSADVALERVTTGAGPRVRIAATDVSLALGDGTRNILTLTDGEALFVTGTSGIAGRVGGTVTLQNVPGVSLAGTLALEVNTTNALVNEVFVVGGVSTTLELAASVPLRVRGTDVSLTIAGQSLSGDVTVTKSTSSLTVSIANGSLSLGTATAPLVRATAVTGTLVLLSAGMYGSISASVAVDIPALTLAGTFTVEVNTTAVDQPVGSPTLEPGLRIVATGATLTVAGQSLGGNVVIERRPGTSPEVSIAVADMTLSLGGFVTVTAANHWTGALLITPGGIAATFSGNTSGIFTGLPSGLTLSGGDVSFAINTGPAPVDRTFSVTLSDGTTASIVLAVPAGPFLRVTVGSAANPATLAVGSVSFSGSFLFSQTTRVGFPGPGTPVGTATTDDTPVAVGDVDGDGTVDLLIGSAAGAALFLGTGPGTFASTGTALGGGSGTTTAVTLADLDGDTRLDAVVVRDGVSTVHRNLGFHATTGAWLGLAAAPVTLTTPDATSVAVGDVDGSGFRDVVVGASGPTGTTATRIFLNLGRTAPANPWLGFAAAASLELANTATTGVALGDLDNDGLLDLVVANTGVAHSVYRNLGPDALEAWQPFDDADVISLANTAAVTGVAIGDLTGDRYADVVVSVDGGPARVYVNRGSVAATVPAPPSVGWQGLDAGVDLSDSPTAPGGRAVALADVDADGALDVVLATSGAPVLFVNRGTDGTGTWRGMRAGMVMGGSATGHVSVALVNVDGDTDLDVVLGGSGGRAEVLVNASVPITLMAFTDVTVALTADVGVTDGQGAFLIVGGTGGGVAGTFSGKASAGTGGSVGGGFSADISVAARFNSTTSAVDEIVEVAGTPIAIVFGATEVATVSGPFIEVSGSGVIKLGDFVEIRGSVTFGTTETTFSDVQIFLGQGPGFLDDGSPNPTARGISVTGASGRVILVGTERALSATGTVSLVGIPGVVLSGTIKVLYNETTAVQFSGTAFEVAAGLAGTPYALLGAENLTLSVGGQSLTGAFSFEQSGPNLTVRLGTSAFAGGTITLSLGTPGSGGAAPVVVTVPSGELTISPAGVYGIAVVTLVLTVPGVEFDSGPVELRINTTTAVQAVSAVDLPAGSFRVQLGTVAAPVSLSFAGQSLSGVFAFEQVTGTVAAGAPAGTPAPKIIRVVASNVAVTLGTASSGMALTAGTGLFVLTPAGMAGRVSGDVDFGLTGFTFEGAFSLAVNSTTSAVRESVVLDGQTIALDLPGGPYLRVEGTDLVLVMAGQRIAGDFVFEQATVGTGSVVRVAARDVSASFGDGTTAFVTVTGGTGFFVIGDPDGAGGKQGGLAGRLSGTVSITVPGVSLSGALTLAVNSRPLSDGAVTETIAMGTQPGTPTSAVVGDVNGDARPDLVLGTTTGILLYLNDGSGDPFDAIPAILLGPATDDVSTLALGDLTGDSALDLVVGRSGATTIVYLGDGTGAFTPATAAPALGTDARSVVIGDVKGSAFADVLVVDGAGTSITLFENNGTDDTSGGWLGVAAGATLSQTVGATALLAIGRIDGDAHLDLFLASGAAAEADGVLLGVGDGTFVTGVPPGTTGSLAAVLADVDGNGTLDLVRATGTGVGVARNPGAATWGGFDTASVVLASGTFVALAVGDLDGDARADLVATDGSGPAQWHVGAGTGSGSTAFGPAHAIGTITLDLPAGPYVQVIGNPVTLTVAGLELTGSFSFTQQTQPDGTRLVTVTVTGLSLTLDGIGVVTLSGGLVLSPTGLAGELTLGTALSFGAGVGITGTFTLQLNNGTAAVVLPSGTRLPGGPYVRFLGEGIVLDFGGPTLTADLSVESSTTTGGQRRTVIAVAGGSLSFEGVGALLSGVEGIFVLAPGGLAGSLRGTVNLSGVLPDGVTFSGTFGLAINRTAGTVTESVTVGGQTLSLDLPAGPYLRVFGEDIQVALFGQSLTGNVAFEQVGTGPTATTTISFSEVELRLGDGTTDLVVLSNGEGTFTLSSFDPPGPTTAVRVMVGSMSVDVAVNVPGVTLGGTFALEIDTTPGASKLRVGGIGLTLEIGGQRLGGTFWFEQETVGTRRLVSVTASNVSLFLGDDGGTAATTDDRGLSLTGGAGSLLITPEGIAADVSGTITLVGMADLPFAVGPITVALQVNTMPTAVEETTLGLDLPAGRFLRLQIGTTATPFTLDLFGQSISGIFLFEQVRSAGVDGIQGTTDDKQVLKVAATEVSLFVGAPGTGTNDDGDEVGIRVSNGTALLLITPDGIAGSISATASLLLGGTIAPVSATVTVTINQLKRVVGGKTMPVEVDEEFVIDGVSTTLALPAGNYLTVAVTGLAIDIAGQRLTADVSVERRARLDADGSLPASLVYDLTVRFANAGLRLGTAQRDIVVVSNGSGVFQIIGATAGTPGGIAGRMSASVAVDVPGVLFSGTFELQLNTTTTNRTVDAVELTPGLKVSGLGITLEVAGQRLTGSFSFQKNATTGEIQIGLLDVSLALGNGTTTFVTLTVASGAILITPARAAVGAIPASTGGIAARITASIILAPSLSSSFSLTGATAELVINTTSAAVTGQVDVGGTLIGLSVPAGPYLRVQVGQVGAPVSLTVMGQSLQAVVAFEQRTTSAGTKVVRVSFTEVALFLGDAGGAGTADDVGVRLTAGAGAIILTPAGLAGEITGTVALVGLPVSLSARLTLQLNNTAVAVVETIQFAGVDLVTTTQGSASVAEVQTVLLTQTAGSFTLAVDVNGNGRIDTGEISDAIEITEVANPNPLLPPTYVLPTPGVVQAALDDLLGAGVVTVAAVAGGWTVTWAATGNRAPIVGNARLLSLPKGPFLRLLANDVDITIGGVVIRADVAFDRAGPVGSQVTRIAFANASISNGAVTGGENPGLKEASGALLIFAPGAITRPSTPSTPVALTTTTGGVAGLLVGRVGTGGGSFGLDASVGFSINTTGAVVDQTIDLGSGGTLVV